MGAVCRELLPHLQSYQQKIHVARYNKDGMLCRKHLSLLDRWAVLMVAVVGLTLAGAVGCVCVWGRGEN